jgi:hypothetical protein
VYTIGAKEIISVYIAHKVLETLLVNLIIILYTHHIVIAVNIRLIIETPIICPGYIISPII